MKDLIKFIQQLELSLLNPEIRKSPDKLMKLIPDDFVEIGASGNMYTKQDILKVLSTERIRNFNAHNFLIRELSESVILVTYKIIENSMVSLRSSIWQHNADGWRMIFHQGTRLDANTGDLNHD